MNKSEIIKIQKKIGVDPDGFWGPKSIQACKNYLKSLMPKNNPWPTTDDKSMIEFYGQPGKVELQAVSVPFDMFLYDSSEKVSRISVHKLLAESFEAILHDILKHFPTHEEREASGITKYYGCYNDRNMRNGTRKSKHAWAAAVDFDMPRNKLKSHWPVQAHMPLEIMECFARQGWKSAGAFWNFDAMHHEATQ